MLRTHKLNKINESLVGQTVTLCGWVDTIRVHGNVAFIDLRDRYGKVQAVISKKSSEDFEKVKRLTIESSISIKGMVNARPEGTINEDLDSGKVELKISELEVFSQAEALPFEINREDVNDEIRMKYRYLDLRSEKMKRNILYRHKIVSFIRKYLDELDFLEITTPILTKSSPEGARDYIVPARNYPGKFYALPQAPQQYKQLLMVGGIDKYFQIAPCFRDEDARADRAPGEFYQLDMEMSFVEQQDILDIVENMFTKMIKEILPEKKLTFDKFKVLTYDEAMEKYKTDKPDLRENKDDPNELAFAWIVDFPLFEEEKTDGHYAPMHHMFTRPKDEDLDKLTPELAGQAKSYQHDLVLNGYEVGGGSVRIHDPEVQKKIFDLIGFSEEQKKYFDHMITAFGFGVPPHGGIAPGIDRLLMVLLGEKHLREVVAFPKNKEARDLVMDAPSFVDKAQLDEVHISVKEESLKDKEE